MFTFMITLSEPILMCVNYGSNEIKYKGADRVLNQNLGHVCCLVYVRYDWFAWDSEYVWFVYACACVVCVCRAKTNRMGCV